MRKKLKHNLQVMPWKFNRLPRGGGLYIYIKPDLNIFIISGVDAHYSAKNKDHNLIDD